MTDKKFKEKYKNYVKIHFNKVKSEIIKKWGNHALSDLEVAEIGDELLGKKFKGVFPIDRVPINRYEKYMIANVDKSGLPGSHWVAIYTISNRIYIYDSFSRSSKKLLKPLYNRAKERNYKIIDVNKKPDQKSNSMVCGPISISWLYMTDIYGIKNSRSI